METKTKIIGTATLALIVGFMASLGVNINPGDQGYLPYDCEKDTISDMLCYKLSRVNDNDIQRNCYYNRDKTKSYKVCSTGWQRLDVEDEKALPTYADVSTFCKPMMILAITENGKYYCNGAGDDADCISADEAELPIW